MTDQQLTDEWLV